MAAPVLPKFLTGKNTRVHFDPDGANTVLYCMNGSISTEVGEDEVSNGESGEWAEFEPTLNQGNVNLTLKALVDTPVQLELGDALELEVDKEGGETITIPCWVRTINKEWATNGAYTVNVTCRITGTPVVVANPSGA